MKKITFLAGLIMIGLGSAASSEPVERVMARDGISYKYTVEQRNGYQLISGTTNRGGKYTLVVRGKRVTGRFNGNPISFTTNDAVRANVTLASN